MLSLRASSMVFLACFISTACAEPLLKPAVVIRKLELPSNVLAADINNDRHPDLVIRSNHSLHILLGDGAGKFRDGAASPIDLPISSSEMSSGDINNDGNLDLAIAAHNTYAVTILLGDGSGKFSPAPGSPFITKRGQHPHTHGVALADLNGDGKLDLLTANSDDNDVAVMLGDGKGNFASALGSPFPCGKNPYPLTLADVTGDGKLDVIVPSCASPGSISIHVGSGSGGFAAPMTIPCDERPYFIAVGDIDGDRKLDLIASHDDADTVTIFIGDGKGGARRSGNSPFHLGKRAWQLVIADMDRDGNMDLIAATEDAIRIFLGDGRGGFLPAPGSPFQTGKGTWTLAVADFNSDKKLDVAASSLESNQVFLLLGN